MGRFWCGPAPEQNVQANAQINERDKPLTQLERVISRNRDDIAHFNSHALPIKQIRGAGINAAAVKMLFKLDQVLDGLVFRQTVDAQ